MKTAIVLGTSRQDGNTKNLVSLYQKHVTADVFNLSDLLISPYDYEHHNKNDAFLPLVKALLSYDHIIFASPVYWYSMSTQMKMFFDRLSDILTIEKSLGRKLRGKSCSVLATGIDKSPPECFEQPFELSAKYLGMLYKKMLYCSCDEQFIIEEHNIKLLNYIGTNET
ncbi:MAG: NAD(P)H-dependent oxidoreductase [Colwellia sp.]|nr:NAD(P)H-dependent oxidoreductase [Colwellia sp.]